MRRTAVVTAGMLALIVGLLAGCTRVPAPTSDSTVPILHWTIRNSTIGETNEYTGNVSKEVRIGDRFVITLRAEDPEGLHEISLAGSSDWSCDGDGIRQQHGPGLGVPRTQTLEPDADNTVLTSTIMITNLTMGPYDCGSNYRLSGAGESLIGTGTNFFGGRARATLILNVVVSP
jgi:hypothetical protein